MNPQTDPSASASLGDRMRSTTNMIAWIIRAWSLSIEVFIRKGFGARYIGIEAALVIPIVMVYCLLWPGYELGPMMAFLAAFLAMCFIAQTECRLHRLRGGEYVHSRYNGWPRIKWLFRRMDELKVKRSVEPLLVGAIGMLVLALDQPLGTFLLLGSFALAGSGSIDDTIDRVRAMDQADALIYQRTLVDRLRGMNGVLN